MTKMPWSASVQPSHPSQYMPKHSTAINEWSWNFFIFCVSSWAPCLLTRANQSLTLALQYVLTSRVRCLLNTSKSWCHHRSASGSPSVATQCFNCYDLGEKMPDPHQDHQVAVQSSTLKASKKTSIIIQINSYTLAEKITLTPPQSRVQNISNHWEPSASPSEQRVPSMQRYLWTILDVLDLAATKIPRACKNRTQNRTCLHNLRHIHVDIRRFYRAVLASWLEHTAIGSIRSCVRIYGPSDFRLQRCPR
jgi:hypothetical protein